MTQLLRIENGLGDRVFGTGLDLPFKSTDLFFEIEGTRIYANTNGKSRWLADRVIAQVQPVVEFIDHVGQTDRVNIENSSRVGVRPHLWRIAGDDQKVMQAKRSRTQKVG